VLLVVTVELWAACASSGVFNTLANDRAKYWYFKGFLFLVNS